MRITRPQPQPQPHSPRGPLQTMAGWQLRAVGARVEWRRDPLDVYTIGFDVPAGADRLEVEFDLLTLVDHDVGRLTATPKIVGVQWIKLIWYPRGYAAADIPVQASVKLPAGFDFGGALEIDGVRRPAAALCVSISSASTGAARLARRAWAPSGTLLAVTGVAYRVGRLKEAVTQAKSGATIDQLVKADDRFRSVRMDYRGGLR